MSECLNVCLRQYDIEQMLYGLDSTGQDRLRLDGVVSHSINPILRGGVLLTLHYAGGDISPTLYGGIINKNIKNYIFNSLFLHIGLFCSICAIFIENCGFYRYYKITICC